jgi:hypothetical protein
MTTGSGSARARCCRWSACRPGTARPGSRSRYRDSRPWSELQSAGISKRTAGDGESAECASWLPEDSWERGPGTLAGRALRERGDSIGTAGFAMSHALRAAEGPALVPVDPSQRLPHGGWGSTTRSLLPVTGLHGRQVRRPRHARPRRPTRAPRSRRCSATGPTNSHAVGPERGCTRCLASAWASIRQRKARVRRRRATRSHNAPRLGLGRRARNP